jgi:formylmethanofuran dehydrogenase subunit C
MKGGSITVQGNADSFCGYNLRGGVIRVEGEIRSIARNIEHGKIYYKGILIVDK